MKLITALITPTRLRQPIRADTGLDLLEYALLAGFITLVGAALGVVMIANNVTYRDRGGG